MLRPKKSLLGLFGLTSELERARKLRNLIPCENCALSPCQYRRAPYRNGLPQIEDVSRLQKSVNGEHSAGHLSSVLNAEAIYSINTRALQKWSNERLRIERSPAGSIKASFRYDGTTCSNMGRPLAFDYHVSLSSPEDRYRIVELSCGPSPGDIGYKSMCEYLSDPETLMTRIALEKPLLGLPLDEVLRWQRNSNPAGCYCDAEKRMHKWGLVFEVLHFALVNHSDGEA
jgi:hypothetical protein